MSTHYDKAWPSLNLPTRLPPHDRASEWSTSELEDVKVHLEEIRLDLHHVHMLKTSTEYLAQSQGSDRLPRMVQLRLLQAFENTGRIGAVGVPGQGLAIDYQLVMEIRRFEIDVAGPATARARCGALVQLHHHDQS